MGVVALLALAGAYALATRGGDVSAPAGTANLWVDTTGGSCTRQATAGEYVDAAACDTLDAAQDAAEGGDTVRVRNGTYTAVQDITGAKASAVTYIGESTAGVVFTAQVDLERFVELRRMTFENDEHGAQPHPLAAGYDDVTLRDVDVLGDYAHMGVFGARNWAWIGGRMGDFDGTIDKRWCQVDHVPFLVSGGAANVLVEGVHFSSALPSEANENGCPSNDNVHLEIIRVDDASSDVTIRRNTIDPNGSNSATIFISDFGDGSPTDLKIVGNVIGNSPTTAISLQNQDCTGYVIAYNTIDHDLGTIVCTAYTGMRIVGNIVGHPGFGTPTCASVQWRNNVNQAAADRGCDTGDDSGNIWVSGPDYDIDAVGVTADGHLRPDSEAIDAGETPGAGDICTDASIMGARGDIDGDARPQGARCDAGADERTP